MTNSAYFGSSWKKSFGAREFGFAESFALEVYFCFFVFFLPDADADAVNTVKFQYEEAVG